MIQAEISLFKETESFAIAVIWGGSLFLCFLFYTCGSMIEGGLGKERTEDYEKDSGNRGR